MDWNARSWRQDVPLTLQMLREHADQLNWEFVSRREDLPLTDLSVLREFAERLDWYWISRRSDLCLTPEIALEFIDRFDWEAVFAEHPAAVKLLLTVPELRAFEDQIDWADVSRRVNFTEEELHAFADRLNWRAISVRPFLTEAMMRTFSDRLSWDLVVCRQHALSYNFIKDFKKFVFMAEGIQLARVKQVIKNGASLNAILIRLKLSPDIRAHIEAFV